MIKIKIPNNNINEREYILYVIFNEFLGLDYSVTVASDSRVRFPTHQLATEKSDRDRYEIVLENGNKLIIEDHFFSKFHNDLEYLNEKNIPQKVEFGKNNFTPEDDIPIIYGTNKLITNNQSPITITCGIDIFASSFFMLTRWEEYANKRRDNHNRFPASESLAFKNKFLHRPVVNEYVEMLKNMLLYLGLNQKPKTRNYKLILTHDIDVVYRYLPFKKILREIAGDILKRKDIKLAYKNLKGYIRSLINKKNDPFNTYNYLMDISESSNLKSYFFLHSSKSSLYDIDNLQTISKIVSSIKERGHFIGYHPSYNAYNDLKLFIKDKKNIEALINKQLTFGRQHYLRCEIPYTWQVWNDASMDWDSTMGYADKEGFRCGVCYEFNLFNILTREKLHLKEKPLIVMDGTLVEYQIDMSAEEILKKIEKLKNRVKKYEGDFVLLWHNSSLNYMQWKKYKKVYEEVVKS